MVALCVLICSCLVLFRRVFDVCRVLFVWCCVVVLCVVMFVVVVCFGVFSVVLFSVVL